MFSPRGPLAGFVSKRNARTQSPRRPTAWQATTPQIYRNFTLIFPKKYMTAMSGMTNPPTSQRERASAFTLLELLIVVGIIGLLLVLIAPAFTYIKGGTDVTSAAYTIKGVLDTARTYAKANNTYTWVGFFEEDVSQSSTNPATAGPGRIVISIVASKDGSNVYGSVVGPAADMDANGTKLLQVGKLINLDN